MNQTHPFFEMLPFAYEAEAESEEEMRRGLGRSRSKARPSKVKRSSGAARTGRSKFGTRNTNSRGNPGKSTAVSGRAAASRAGRFSSMRSPYIYPANKQNIFVLRGRPSFPRQLPSQQQQDWQDDQPQDQQQAPSAFIRWVQQRLNQLLGLQLPLSGWLGRQDRNALRRLQYRCGLPRTGRLDMASRNCLFQLQAPPEEPMPSSAAMADGADGMADASGAGDESAGDEGEIPANIQQLIASRPQLAKYADAGSGRSLQQVAADASLKGVGGVYLITFDDRGQRRAYSGTTSDLQRRLRQHLHCLKFPLGLQRSYTVYYEAINNPVQARKKEAALNTLRNSLGGSLVNLTTELEAELFA